MTRAASAPASASAPAHRRQVLYISVLIALYLLSNLALTFYSKLLLSAFPRPYLLTALHTGVSAIGCRVLSLKSKKQKRALAQEHQVYPSNAQAESEQSDSSGEVDQSALEKGSISSQESSEAEENEKLLPGNEDGSSDVVEAKEDSERRWSDWLILQGFALLYATNIAVSNASLGLVSIPVSCSVKLRAGRRCELTHPLPFQFHQVLRSICPLFTIVLSRLILHKSASFTKLLALLPVVVGAILACFGDLSFTPLGFALTLLGTILAAFKTVITNYLQAGAAPPSAEAAAATPAWKRRAPAFTKYSSMELLAAVSPAACVYCLIFSLLSGECAPALSALFSSLAGSSSAGEIAQATLQHRGQSLQIPMHGIPLILCLLGNGLLAFALNVVSFRTNKASGAVAMTVMGNVKQVITVLLALVFLHASARPLNLVGIALTLAGSAIYGFVALRERKPKR